MRTQGWARQSTMMPVRTSTLVAFTVLLLLDGISSLQIPYRLFLSSRIVSTTSMLASPLSNAIREEQLPLSTGVSMTIASASPNKPTDKPVLLFLHGSFHGAWCWTEKFFPYFVELGYPVVALNWRGTGGTFAGEGVKKVKIMDHVEDLREVLAKLPSITGRTTAKPVVITHSFGGLAVMKLLEHYPDTCAGIAGLAVICSVPPSGNGSMTMRFLRRSLRNSWKITMGLAMKKCTEDAPLCRQLFFGDDKVAREDGTVDDLGVSDEEIARYQTYMKRDSKAIINLLDLAKQLPSAKAVNGKALFADTLSPCIVIGATDDFIVDIEGNRETATYFAAGEPLYVDSPHDVMLGPKWMNCASALDNWIREKVEIER